MDPIPNDAGEGDVETLIVLPLLTRPGNLGIPNGRIRSKEGIAARDIGKGSKLKVGYIPDYCVYVKSLPTLIVEAKRPYRDVYAAYGEARLYATEINRSFPHNLNPCSRIISTDGTLLLAGYWDSDPDIAVRISELDPASPAMDRLINLAGYQQLLRAVEPINNSLKAKDYRRPFNQGAGQAQINSRLEPNTFAADLSPILRRYFTSRDQTTDYEIYSKAYVSSNEVSSYDRILEFFLKDRLSRARKRTEVTTTRKKSTKITQAISNFGDAKPVGGDLQLVTGSVGVGKSLFARRYKEFLQPTQMADKNHWAFLDFVKAPEDPARWNEWVCLHFVESLLEEGAPIDLRDGDDQERVFANDLADRSAYYKRMSKVDPSRGELERARDLEQWRTDSTKLTVGISRYLQGDRGENLIVVFDNVDKLETDTQLAAFQTALWFMDQTRCLVVLQMRDTTFEAFKDRPPLDTYKSGQIFHISPPRFVDVVRKRLEVSLNDLSEHAPEQVKFQTRSGITMSYPSTRAGEFLKGIYIELFQKPNNVSRILEALAGRNVRSSLDMFMAIITSGHMPEDVIASVAQGSGFKTFPEYRILRALMRQDYRYFNNNSGFVANIFNTSSKWFRPSNLIIPEILFFMLSRRKDKGDDGQIGFMAMARLVFEMEALGFVEDDIAEASAFCLSKGLIEVETSSPTIIRPNDSIKATASAWAHMRILSSRVEYIASVLPTTPISDKNFNARVYEYMQHENRFGQVNIFQQMQLTELFIIYLEQQRKSMMAHPGFNARSSSGSLYVIEKMRDALRFARNEGNAGSFIVDKLDI